VAPWYEPYHRAFGFFFYIIVIKWHADKQIHRNSDESVAIDRFREIQNAYEILTDEKERSSYDARLRRLQKKTGSSVTECMAPPPTFVEVAEVLFDKEYMELAPKLESYGELFLKIAAMEKLAYPDFLLKDGVPIQVFYAEWGSFATGLDFEWVQQPINPSYDRRVRRAIEQDNNKARKLARKEYNEHVRLFTEFVKRRDSRYKEYQAMLSEKKRKEEEQAAAAAAAALELKKQKQKEYELDRDSINGDCSEEEIIDQQIWHCPACEKYFKSKGSFFNHEKSKKHIKNVEVLRQILIEEEGEDILLSFDNIMIDDGEKKEEEEEEEHHPNSRDDMIIHTVASSPEKEETVNDQDDQRNKPKKKKTRRRALEKTKDGKKKGGADASLSCSTCKETFASRNQLFKHLKTEGHAAFK
jgi:DnaJ family protein A protein 5